MASRLKLEVLLQAVDRATAPFQKISKQSTRTAQALKAHRDELRQLERTQRQLQGFVKLSEQTRATGEQLSAARDRLQALRRELRQTNAPTEAFQHRFLKAQEAVKKLEQSQLNQRRRLGEMRNALQAAGIDTAKVTASKERLRAVEDRLQASMGQANQRIKEQQERLRQLNDQQGRAARLNERVSTAHRAGMVTAGHGAGLIFAGQRGLRSMSNLITPGLEFDTTMTRVQSLTRLDKDSPELAALREQARHLGATTMFSATDAAAGQAFLAMAGFTPESIRAAMPGLLDMAKAGDMDLGRTADIASNILSSFGINPSEMGKVADVLTKTFTTSNVNLEMLGNTMQYVGPVAREAGMNLEEAAAMAGLLGNVGIQGEKAGTTLRAMLLRLSAPAGAAAKEMARLGISAKDSEGNIRPIIDVISDVAWATEKMGSAERLETLKAIFGEEPAAGMAELINQAGSGGILEYLKVVQDNQGAAAKTATIMADNLRGDLDQLASAWADVQIQLFEGENATIRRLTQDITALVGRVGAWIKANPELTSQLLKWLAVLAAATAALGSVLVAIGAVLMLVKPLVFFIKTLGAVVTAIRAVGAALWVLAANPAILALIAVIGVIAGGAYLIWKNWDWLGPKFLSLWEDIKSKGLELWEELKAGFSGGIGGIAETILNFSPLGLFYRAFAGVMNYFGIELPERFSEFGRMLLSGFVDGIRSMAGMAREAISGIADGVAGWFKDKLGIRSPSRVFAEAGRDTLAGYQLGLAQSESGVLKQVDGFSKRMRQAGAGVMLGAAALPAAAGVQFDGRAPLAATVPAPVAGGDVHYHININTAPGMDEQAVARLVATEIQRLERAKAARRRSALYDTE